METRPWPDKLQQSVQTTIANMDNGNNLLDSTTNNTTIQDNTNNNEDKCNRNFQLQQDVQAAISEKGRQKIQSILELVNTLPPLEKLLLYLKLPTEHSTNTDPLRQSLNPLGSRSEINQTITWIQTHLEEDKELSLQKKGVYDDYVAFCERNTIKPLSTADFGKVMKQVYPEVRPRRLGTRGKSKYCYSGLRSRIKLSAPNLPDLQDKYLSTEPHFSQHELMTAAWMIIKEWAETKFSVEFKNIIKLAYYLVKEYSVGIGTDAANQIFSANVKEASYSHLNKHKETTLQLQRKLQQKTEGKEIKRKQSPRIDSKSRKKFKASPPSTSCSTSPVAASDSKSSPQSQEHSPVCDSINLHSLPDFNCFQRPPSSSEPQLNDLSQQAQGEYPTGKVAIPRITNAKQPPSPKRTKQVKCKAIQPKPELCDTSYNPKQTLTARNIRSQQELNKRQRFRKKDSPTLLIPEESSTLFSRERLISIGQVNKEDLDEYLGKSNSQEPEEEIMQYFSNSNEDPETNKISQLRQLLEQSRIAQNQNVSDGILKAPISGVNTTKTNLKLLKSAIPPNLPNLSAKRRVSFDTQVHEEAVPASPNTRRQNINFIPISPSSPNERQSKCSSTNASPFVSPRNTPVARAKGNAHTYVNNFTINKLNYQQLQLIKLNKPEKLAKPNLEIRIPENPDDNKQFYKTQLTNLPMSAPPSPKTNYIYGKNYPNHPQMQNINLNDPLSPEISQLFVNNVHSSNESNFRSQSVPLNQFFNTFTFGTEQNLISSEFNDYDCNNENINLNKIIDDIDNSSLDMLNINLNQNELENASNVQLNENINLPIESTDLICIQNNNLRGLGRSQSIDVEGGNQDYREMKFPSRSVPTTPLPFHTALDLESLNKNLESLHGKMAKSYPSTPLTSETFKYNLGQDYLLNGQPIKDKLVDVGLMQCDDNKAGLFEAYNETDLIDNKNFNFDGPIPEGSYGANKQNINPVLNQGVDDFFKVVPE